MKQRGRLNSVSRGLRSTVKKMLMGDYLTPGAGSPCTGTVSNQKGNRFALVNCNIFDGIRTSLAEGMTVLFEGERILEVGHTSKVLVPDGFIEFDLKGQTLMPGMLDNHVHAFSPFTYAPNRVAVRQMPQQIALNLMQTVYNGVTTVCDMGGPPGFIKEFTALADKDQIPGPRFLNSFTLISPRKGKTLGYPSQVQVLNPFKAWLMDGQVATRPRTVEELKKVCYQVKEDGGTHLKTTYQPQPFSLKKPASQDDFPIFDDDWLKTILSIGKELDLFVDVHAPYGDAAERFVNLAIETGAKIRIQHMTIDRELKGAFLQKMSDHGFSMIPTVMVFGDAFHLKDFISWLESEPKAYMMPEANSQMRARLQHAIDSEPYSGQIVMDHDYPYLRDRFACVRLNTQKAHDAGIIGIGTDTGGTNTGFFGRMFTEIEYYLDFGIAITDILKYLTSVNAGINGLNDRGVIQAGKLADLIGIEGNPFADPKSLTRVATVIKGGVFLKKTESSGTEARREAAKSAR